MRWSGSRIIWHFRLWWECSTACSLSTLHTHSNLVAKVRAFAKEHEVLIRYEMLRQQIRDNAEEHKEKIHWFFSLKSGIALREHLSRYLELERTLDRDDLHRHERGARAGTQRGGETEK